VEKAATLVREMAPKFIETIVSHLVPVSSPPHSEAAPGQPPHQFHPQQQTFVSPPVETVVVVEVPANTSIPTSSHTGDTVSNGAKENLCNVIRYMRMICNVIRYMRMILFSASIGWVYHCRGSVHCLSGVDTVLGCVGSVQQERVCQQVVFI
jgi:hypothetical protein